MFLTGAEESVLDDMKILNGKTGAYIASRIVGECVAEWFEEYSEEEYSSR